MENVETTEQGSDRETKIFVNSFIGTIEDRCVLRVWGMCRDVTETREVEKQIHLRQKAIDSGGDGFVIADATRPELPLIYVNPRFEELTGYRLDEILGRNCRFLQGADTDSETAMKVRDALLSETRFEGEILNYRKDGSRFWNLLRISPVRDQNGTLTHFVALQTDITKQKQADEASRQQREQLAQFSRAATLVEIGGALAHELNQPLAAILRNAQAARRFLDRDAPDLDEIREILADIVKDDRRAGDVLSRIRQHLKREETPHDRVDVNEVIQDCLKLLHSELIIQHVYTVLQLAGQLPSVLGDAVQLQQVVLNLILNALDAMREVEPEQRRLTISTSSDNGDTVHISVSDSGSGIDEDELERIFDPFHTTKNDGMGVGLAINRTIVEAHDGKVWAENLPEQGARLTFKLPAIRPREDDGDR